MTGTFRQLGVLDPQALLAATQIKPPTNDAPPNDTVILFVVDEPLTPFGSVHV